MTSSDSSAGPGTTENADARGFDAVLDATALTKFQISVIVLCASVAMIDGFDTQSIALAAPDIASSWGVDASAFGFVFGIGLFGGLLGAMISGPLSDRYGRRPCLLAAVALFSVFTLVAPFTGSLTGLVPVRFVTGLGLGAALPGIISITSEYTPTRMRATVVGLMFCGFPLGAAVGGVAAAPLISVFGWGSVFWVGGAIPLVLLPLLWLRLPESARFLAMTGNRAKLGSILSRMGSAVRSQDIEPEPAATRSPVVRLFTGGRTFGTLLLWATLFLSLLLTYLLLNWIPLLARQSGIGTSGALLGVVALNIGAIAGCLVIGRLADRGRSAVVIGAAFALGTVAIAAIGHSGGSGAVLLATAFAAGFCSIGAQMCVVALVAAFYETSLRATGVGWAMGIGRVGAIAGPVLGGILIDVGTTAATIFLIAGLASLGAAAGVLAVGRFTPGARSSRPKTNS